MLYIDFMGLNGVITSLKKQAETAVSEACSSGAQSMEVYAKANAPWTDRTGNARRTIEGFVEQVKNGRNIGVAGQMSYSPSLELLHGKRYAILYPTVQAKANEVVERLADTVISVELKR